MPNSVNITTTINILKKIESESETGEEKDENLQGKREN